MPSGPACMLARSVAVVCCMATGTGAGRAGLEAVGADFGEMGECWDEEQGREAEDDISWGICLGCEQAAAFRRVGTDLNA